MNRHALTDEQWSAVSPRIPQQRGPQSERANRNFIDAVVWLATAGAPWRDLDASFGPWKTVYNRFRNWALRGWWKQLFRDTPFEEKVGSILDASYLSAVHGQQLGYGFHLDNQRTTDNEVGSSIANTVPLVGYS